MDWDEQQAEPERPSKSQKKREAHALQELGEQLVEMKESQLALVPMPEQLRDAVLEARAIHKHGGRKRQLQYIGKLMRELDAEPIRQALDDIEGNSARETALHHATERWRDRLLDEGDDALTVLLSEHPAADRQQLRQLVRRATAERKAGRPPRTTRELYRVLKTLLEQG